MHSIKHGPNSRLEYLVKHRLTKQSNRNRERLDKFCLKIHKIFSLCNLNVFNKIMRYLQEHLTTHCKQDRLRAACLLVSIYRDYVIQAFQTRTLCFAALNRILMTGWSRQDERLLKSFLQIE